MKKDNVLSTILVISMGFLALFFLFKWEWAAIVSLAVGLAGLLSPYLAVKIDWVWSKLSKLLSYVVPNILLSLVFFLILFPISLLAKLFNKDPLMLSGKHDSYFVEVNKEFDKESFRKTW